MQAGKLIISRGLHAVAEVPPPRRKPDRQPVPQPVRIAAVPDPAPFVQGSSGAVADFHLVRQRLDALERLSLLRDIGVLNAEEFAVEKAMVLRLPSEELQLGPEDMPPNRGPSLLGRLLSWKMIAAGTVIGLCVSAYTAPQDLLTMVDRASRLIG